METEPLTTSEQVRSRWMEHGVRQRLIATLAILEDMIYILLSLLFFLAAMYIMVDAVTSANWHSVPSLIGTTLDRFLLVLMLAELLHTLLIFVRTHQFRHQPFLVVGMIAGIRRILVITAEQTVQKGHIGPYLWDLGVTTMVVLVLALALRIGPNQRGF